MRVIILLIAVIGAACGSSCRKSEDVLSENPAWLVHGEQRVQVQVRGAKMYVADTAKKLMAATGQDGLLQMSNLAAAAADLEKFPNTSHVIPIFGYCGWLSDTNRPLALEAYVPSREIEALRICVSRGQDGPYEIRVEWNQEYLNAELFDSIRIDPKWCEWEEFIARVHAMSVIVFSRDEVYLPFGADVELVGSIETKSELVRMFLLDRLTCEMRMVRDDFVHWTGIEWNAGDWVRLHSA